MKNSGTDLARLFRKIRGLFPIFVCRNSLHAKCGFCVNGVIVRGAIVTRLASAGDGILYSAG